MRGTKEKSEFPTGMDQTTSRTLSAVSQKYNKSKVFYKFYKFIYRVKSVYIMPMKYRKAVKVRASVLG